MFLSLPIVNIPGLTENGVLQIPKIEQKNIDKLESLFEHMSFIIIISPDIILKTGFTRCRPRQGTTNRYIFARPIAWGQDKASDELNSALSSFNRFIQFNFPNTNGLLRKYEFFNADKPLSQIQKGIDLYFNILYAFLCPVFMDETQKNEIINNSLKRYEI